MGVRKLRFDLRMNDQRVSRRVNGVLKNKERDRRRQRLIAKLGSGKLPYTPPVLSWLSAELGIPGSKITQSDVDAYLNQQQAN